MKRLVLLLCCALLVSAPALAQVPGFSFGFGVQGNATNFNVGTSQGDLQQVYGLGIGGGIHLDLGLPLLSFRISGDYLTISPDADKYKSYAQRLLPGVNVGIEGGKIEMWSANANLKLVILPIPIVHPYVTGGAGLARLKFQDATILLNGLRVPVAGGSYAKFLALDSQTKTTANIGAGVDLVIGPLSLYGEVKVNWIFTDPKTSSQVPIGTIGITF
jgi:hypothetical protein